MKTTKTALRGNCSCRLLPVAAVLLGIFGGLVSSAAQAASIPFTEALNFSYNPEATGIVPPGKVSNPAFDWVQTINSAPASVATSSYSQSGTWGSVSGYASADLSTGQLKMQSSITNSDGSVWPYMQTNAWFGDSFTTKTAAGSPFVWNGASATFNMALSGSLDSSNGFANAGAFVILGILQKGSLDPSQSVIGGANGIQYFLWDLGNPTMQIYYTDPSGNSQPLAITAGYTSLPSSLSATFSPGGDFDWVLLLGASGQLGAAGDSFSADLSHTLTLSYVGPEGTVTVADSGLFGNISAGTVPESGTLALLGLGLSGLLASRRRRAF